MIQDFLSHIHQNKLWNASDRLLLAVSGGADSMALLHLCWKASFSFEVGHVNYGFRGNESDLDQALVQAYCQERQIPCHILKASKEDQVFFKANNLQAKARDFRYTWLTALLKERDLDFLVTAHHAQDQAETVLWHWMRGTGVQGLAGIAAKSDILRRPLLFFHPPQLVNFLKEERIDWRLDASNLSLDYTRNQVRHLVVPVLEDIRTGSIGNMAQSAQEVQAILPFLRQSWEDFLSRHQKQWRGIPYFDSVGWIQSPLTSWMVSWWLKPLGFSNTQIQNLKNATFSSEMKRFEVKDKWVVWVNQRFIWFVEAKHPLLVQPQLASQTFESCVESIAVEGGTFDSTSFQRVDSTKLNWPVILRTRQAGDRIYLQKGKKKVSDVMIDAKIPSFFRNHWPVLVDAEGILRWIPGIWIDPSIKASDSTVETVKFYSEPWRMP